MEGVVEVGIGNPEDLNDLGNYGKEEDLGLYRKNLDDSFIADYM